jgi:hypothetical protein
MGFSTTTPAVLTYLPATNLYVNSGSGNDSGDGTISNPLQSLEEGLKNVYARRLNGDDTFCRILLSGNVGDYDDIPAIVYYWPSKYMNSMGLLDIMGWDGAQTNPDTDAPAYLYTGSATLWANPNNSASYVAFTNHDQGSVLGLFTDAGYTTPAYFGAAGSTGPLSQGWQLVANTPGRGRPIAHVVDHLGNTNTIRIAGPNGKNTWDQSGSANGNGTSWDTLGRGSSGLKVIKYGAKIDFTELQTAADVNASIYGMGNYKQNFWFLELTSSNLSSYPNSAFGIAGGRMQLDNCHLLFEVNSFGGGRIGWTNCYVGSNDGFEAGSNGGQSIMTSCVVDGQWRPNEVFGFKNYMQTQGYTIFQNYDSSTSGLSIAGDCRLANNANANFSIFHITASAGIGGSQQVRTEGPPQRLMGRINSATDYSLRLISGSTWNWNTANAVVRDDGSTVAKVSVTEGETDSSAEIVGGTFIYKYDGGGGVQNDFATDYSASWWATIVDGS